MATHEETRARKQRLNEDLRKAYEAGLESGGKALSLRALSERYGLSMQTVGVELQKLVADGVLYTVPRVGTFMGRPPAQFGGFYQLLSLRANGRHELFNAVQTGFEERIASLGGACDSLLLEEAVAQRAGGTSPVAGQFLLDSLSHPRFDEVVNSGPPTVLYQASPDVLDQFDSVDFDNEEGGEQAAGHLLKVGHRKIAFLALHDSENTSPSLEFSLQREHGWRRTMERSGQRTSNLAFHAGVRRNMASEILIGRTRAAAEEALKHPEITALIASNVYSLHGLLEALHLSKLPMASWPAIVCFDETPCSRASGVSYLRLPWERLGSEAAQLLWERQTGRFTGPPRRRLVKMTLIPRLTCRPEWALNSASSGNRLLNVLASPPQQPESPSPF